MIQRDITYTKTITMVTESCCKCGIIFGMLSDYRERLKNDPGMTFYCPSGHPMHFKKSKEQELREKLETELKDKENQLAGVYMEKIQIESELNKTKKILSRVHKGVCPCCNRSFKNLASHIKTKHPELAK